MEESNMSQPPKKRKRKLLRDCDIPPYQVPDDWEPQSEAVKKLDRLLQEFNKGIPEGLRQKWWKEFRESHGTDDAKGLQSREVYKTLKQWKEGRFYEETDDG
jgi:hypothetical protein